MLKRLIADDLETGLINNFNSELVLGEGDYQAIINHTTLIEKHLEANNSVIHFIDYVRLPGNIGINLEKISFEGKQTVFASQIRIYLENR